MLIILFDLAELSFSLALEGQPKSDYPDTFSGVSDRPSLANDMQDPNNEGYLLQPPSFNDAIDVFDLILIRRHAGALQGQILRPASRDNV